MIKNLFTTQSRFEIESPIEKFINNNPEKEKKEEDFFFLFYIFKAQST